MRTGAFYRACDEFDPWQPQPTRVFTGEHGVGPDQFSKAPKLITEFPRVTEPVRMLDPAVWGEDVMAEVERIYGETE